MPTFEEAIKAAASMYVAEAPMPLLNESQFTRGVCETLATLYEDALTRNGFTRDSAIKHIHMWIAEARQRRIDTSRNPC